MQNNSLFPCNFFTYSDSQCLKRKDAVNAVEVNGSNKWKCEGREVARPRVFSAHFAICEQ